MTSQSRSSSEETSDYSDDEMDNGSSLVHVLESRKINCPQTEHIVRTMLADGADVNRRGHHGRPPLMVAASKKGSARMLKILLEHGADLCAQDQRGFTALMDAVCSLCSKNVNFLLRFTNKQDFLNLRNCEGRSALLLAVSYVKINAAREMISYGADVNIQDMYGDTPLLQALLDIFHHDVQFLTTLLDAGCDVNHQNNNGLSPLMLAASSYTAYPMRFRLGSGAAIKINYLEPNSPFKEYGSVLRPNIRFLRTAFGSGLDHYDNGNDVCQKLLAARPHFEQAITTLLEAGADVNAVSKNNPTKTALSFMPSVTYRGTTTIFCMDAFLDKFARSSCVNPVVLQEVVLHGAVDAIPKLIRCGLLPADVRANKDGLGLHKTEDLDLVSPLCLSLLVGNVALAGYFMDNLFLTRSDVSSLTSNKTVRTILERKKHQECLSFLEEMSTQPMLLFKQAFVAVSSAVGVAPDRGYRVEQLPLPRLIKDSLLYNTEQCRQFQ